MSTTRAGTFEQAALLRALEFDFSHAQPEGGRIALYFSDADGEAQAVLRRHERGEIEVNSRAFTDGLRWAKDVVFSARREGGMR